MWFGGPQPTPTYDHKKVYRNTSRHMRDYYLGLAAAAKRNTGGGKTATKGTKGTKGTNKK